MKIVGSLFIIISSILISYRYEATQRQWILNLKSVCRFLEYVRGQIELFSLPLHIIYEKYNDKTECINALINKEELDYFSSSLDKELSECFSELGKSYKDEQLKTLDYAIMKIKKELSQAEKEYAQKIKVFRAIALFVGCSAVILLV